MRLSGTELALRIDAALDESSVPGTGASDVIMPPGSPRLALIVAFVAGFAVHDAGTAGGEHRDGAGSCGVSTPVAQVVWAMVHGQFRF